MSVTPFPAAPVVDRLRDKVGALRLIGDAAELSAALESQPKAVPAAYVVLVEQGTKPAGASGGVLIQQVQVWVIVVLIVRNLRATSVGSEARAEMDLLTQATDDALLNWKPAGTKHEPLWFGAGRDEAYKPGSGQLTHQRIYRSGRRNQVNSNP